MTEQRRIILGGTESAPAAVVPSRDSIDRDGPRVEVPYLKIFGPDIGVFETTLSDKPIRIGRSPNSDVRLPHPKVSRTHAEIRCENGEYTVVDVGSSHGTVVNRRKTKSCALRHGDTIQIGLYLLQFRTHPTPPGAAAAAAEARILLRSDYCMLPSTMRLRYRTLDVAPRNTFQTGDTMRIGHGGMLIPTEDSPGECVCLELDLTWPGDVSKRYLGEVVGVIPHNPIEWMCVKLHSVPQSTHDSTVTFGRPGPWINVLAT